MISLTGIHTPWKLLIINYIILHLQAKECSSMLAVQIQWFYAFSTSIHLVSLKTQNMNLGFHGNLNHLNWILYEKVNPGLQSCNGTV